MSQLNRRQSLQAIPVATTVTARKALPDGGERLSVMVPTRPMQRKLLRLPERIKKDYELDAFGVEIFACCDGKRSVEDILNLFCKKHQLPPQEGETAVLTFIRTLVSRGLIVMTLSRMDSISDS